MNPMNFGGEFGQFTVPPERVNPMRTNWMPLTPEKQFPRSNPVNPSPAEWQQLSGMYGSYIQESSNFSGGAQNFMNSVEGGQNVGYYGCNGDLGDRHKVLNNIAGSYAQAFNVERATQSNNIPGSYAQAYNAERATQSNNISGSYAQFNMERATQSNNISGSYAQFNMERASQSNNIANLVAMRNAAAFMNRAKITQRGPTMANPPPIPDLYSQVDSTWRIPNASTSALADLNHWSSSNQLGTCNSLSDITQHGFHVPGRPDYNLNLPPRTETEVSTRISNSPQIPAVAQNEGNKFQNSQFSAVFNLLIGESSSKEKDHEIVPTAENEDIHHHCNELQNIVDSSSTVISTPFKENKDSEKVSDQDIDLNRTPQLKAPKRRKIRPKVVVEGKPKRVPKSAGHNMDSSSKESPVAKRKYVRKNGLKEPGSQQGDIINSPIPPTPINADSNQKTGKRKYVRKKGVTESAVQKADTVGNDTDPNAGTSAKSCRRGLNFDLEKSSDRDQSTISGGEEAQQIMRPFNLNLEAQSTELYAGTNSSCGARSTEQISQQDRITGTSSATPSMDSILTNYISQSGRRSAGAPQASMDSLHIENANVCSRDIDVGNAGPWQSRSTCGFTPRQQNIYAEGIGQIVFRPKTNENIEATRQLVSLRRPQQVLDTFSHSIESRGSKREYQQMHQQGECYRMSSNSSTDLSDKHKKMRFENDLLRSNYGMPFAKVVEDISTEANTGCINEVRANCFTSQRIHEILNSNFRNCNSPKKPTCGANFLGDFHTHHMAARHSLPHQPTPEKHSYKDRMGETRGVTQVQHLASQTAIANHNRLPPAPSKIAYVPEKTQVNRNYQATALAEKQTAVRASSNSAVILQGRGLQEQKSILMKHISRQSQGLIKQQQHHIQIDKIIHQLESLSLKEAGNAMMRRDQQAIVPYKGDGAIVLHDVKRRKPRPKVDLDPETNRIWKLLMGNEGGEGVEGTDKEKWWEGEREVFRGRADSFIARMHLVQGDRRFSPWKGSVVDSIIGVFLTQNVSDHLSSSAFMCLAARFPPNTTNNDASESNGKSKGKSILIEEPEDCVVNLDESIKSLEKISCLPVDIGSSVTPQKLREQKRDSETSGTERTSFTEVQSQNVEEEVISSQGSNDSSIVQDGGGIRFYSGCNSEAEDPRNGCIYQTNPSSNSINFQEMEKTTIFQECCSHVNESCPKKQSEHPESCMPRSKSQMGALKGSAFTYPITSQDLQMRVPATPSNNCLSSIIPDFGVKEYLDTFSEESTSPWYSTSGIVRTKYENCTNNLAPKYLTQSRIQRNALLRSQDMATARPFKLSSVHSMQQQSISQRGPHAGYDQQLQNNPSGRSKSFLFENTSAAESVNHADALANWNNDTMKTVQNVSKQTDNNSDFVESISVVNNQACEENTPVEPKPKEQVHSSGKPIVEMNIKAKRGKAGNEGKNAVDWDILRKKVQANGRKERSKDAMDTMDYEAMRSAKVKEISDAIKERGMNNMLAERIQDFLNRLVREHGSIDLEWLREVPPDKAKEYLLSIRGLGLKSVECVRLLTLHQLAFPVDTNVGRIAVRLGWVPLQPLPESLQLHLLEMYPMLESIQKYIWPRLCKLDQRTLYELHYQMITFGKVFCTKSKPNCNACPMKGECRHFASAFASARLALPSPEEKGIVSSTFPTAQERNPTAVINPMPLLREAESDGKCNPIIEEPATPEQEIAELLESDIEDMFDEDPDEIPTIKLNIETFTENLQKYMQENMELQEGDMSRALVALNPEAAAIPTPKLKNVSRLRTEHQVYELPDSHPLLTGMDRRESDDPSPYLLAIWTPGETADSIRPPEIKCSFQDTGKLCNEETCFSCNSTRESNSQTVRGTILIPCRTAMRGSFPLNGTYFQVNEMFADHKSSVNPIDVPRSWIWNLPRRTVYFGTSVSTIFKGLSTEGIQYCFWRGFVCVRGFDQETRAPRPLMSRLHCPASKLVKQ